MLIIIVDNDIGNNERGGKTMIMIDSYLAIKMVFIVIRYSYLIMWFFCLVRDIELVRCSEMV